MVNQSVFTIALIDDNEANRYALARHLRQAGYRVLEGATGQEALDLARQRPDLLILDIHLPDSSGIEVCQELKRDPNTAHLLILQTSALFTSTHDRVQGLESGADSYLTAPFEPRELLAQVRALLRIKETESAHAQSEEKYRLLFDKMGEDSPANQKLVQHVLGERGHQMAMASNDREAVALLEQQPFDVVLMDVQMPELDGLEATRKIRALSDPAKARVPIIALTAHALKGDQDKCLAAGMTAYLSKPIKAEEMIRMVEHLAPAV